MQTCRGHTQTHAHTNTHLAVQHDAVLNFVGHAAYIIQVLCSIEEATRQTSSIEQRTGCHQYPLAKIYKCTFKTAHWHEEHAAATNEVQGNIGSSPFRGAMLRQLLTFMVMTLLWSRSPSLTYSKRRVTPSWLYKTSYLCHISGGDARMRPDCTYGGRSRVTGNFNRPKVPPSKRAWGLVSARKWRDRKVKLVDEAHAFVSTDTAATYCHSWKNFIQT
eukprot:1158207-Pelagomonas_calceolata.AAC.3